MSDEPTVAVFGAAGAVGASLSRDLSTDESLSLRLIDVDTTAIDELRSDRVDVIRADLMNPREAAEACQGAGLLMNCLSFAFFEQTLAIAIERRLDYADLVSEPSPEQTAAVEAAGIVAVPRIGAEPGPDQRARSPRERGDRAALGRDPVRDLPGDRTEPRGARHDLVGSR